MIEYDNAKSKPRRNILVNAVRSYLFTFVVTVFLFILGAWIASCLYLLFPEYFMLVFSPCARIYQFDSWNGKMLFDIKVWKFGFPDLDSMSSSYSSTYLSDANDTIFIDNAKVPKINRDRPILIIGVHHKTGTMLAKKMLGSICEVFNLCCVVRVTRDSVAVLLKDIDAGDVDALLHTHWIWYPEQLMRGSPYLFLHFYRNPLRKIASGYAYHRAGIEYWTNTERWYNNSCLLQDHKSSNISISGSSSPGIDHDIDLDHQVHRFCQSSQPCQSCCREEHRIKGTVTDNKIGKKFFLRSQQEYAKLCQYISLLNGSLSYGLQALPRTTGLRVQAALDYYENLRAAHIFNHTKNDPHSINIDIDDFAQNYDQILSSILEHLSPVLSHGIDQTTNLVLLKKEDESIRCK